MGLKDLRRRKRQKQRKRRRFKRGTDAWRRLTNAIGDLNAQIQAAVRRQGVRRTVAFDGTPVFHGLALALQDAREHGWSGGLSSGDRREGVAERFGKFSQAKLYRCSRNCTGDCRGNCNPANPPGRSTHELRSDGVAYGAPSGAFLKWWQLGLDCSEAEELVTVLRRRGFAARRPYSDPREAHHVNFTRNPVRNLRRRRLI